MIAPAWAALAAAAAAGLADWTNRRWRGWLPDDPPRPGRKQHARPMPLAGITIAIAALPWLFAGSAWWLGAGLALATGVGFRDDWSKERGDGLDWRTKGLGLMLAVGLAATEVADPLRAPLDWLACVALSFVLVNATNFLDNTDGVAASLSATSLLVLGGLGLGADLDTPVAWAALGFLPWNWPRPRLFLGDSGAYALGLAVATTASAAALREPWTLGAVAVQLGDFVQVVCARLALGLPPWVGDRRHLTHIAQNLGLPRQVVAPLFAALALAIGLACVGAMA